MFLKLFIINLAVILIVDLSGFIPTMKRKLSKIFTKNTIASDNYSLKPFDCSYCMTFWCLLGFLLYSHELTFITVLYLLIITHFTEVTKQLLLLLKDIAIKIIDYIYESLTDMSVTDLSVEFNTKLEDINEHTISENIYTGGQPDPDLMIRTSRELRTSNFLPWQLTYSEFYFPDKHWPEFGEEDLLEAIRVYQKRNRRFGGRP